MKGCMRMTTAWGQRYSYEVERMTSYYEAVNKNATTNTHKATPEEVVYYESLIDELTYKNKYCCIHRLKRRDE